MAFVLPAAGALFLGYHLARGYDNKVTDLQKATEAAKVEASVVQRYRSSKDMYGVFNAQPTRVIRDVDTRGAPVWRTYYADGGEVTRYSPPDRVKSAFEY